MRYNVILYGLFSFGKERSIPIGTNLKGRACGNGIYQRKDGKYSARFTYRYGKRQEKYFKTLPEVRNWLADAKYESRHDDRIYVPTEMTVDTWFEYWVTNIVGGLAPNTLRNCREQYKQNIQPVIGSMRMEDVKPMHCKMVLNLMESSYAGSTIRQTYIAMGTMFRSAVQNDIITSTL